MKTNYVFEKILLSSSYNEKRFREIYRENKKPLCSISLFPQNLAFCI